LANFRIPLLPQGQLIWQFIAIIIVVTPLFNWLNSKSHFGRRTRYDIGVLVFGVFWEGSAHTPTSGRTLLMPTHFRGQGLSVSQRNPTSGSETKIDSRTVMDFCTLQLLLKVVTQ